MMLYDVIVCGAGVQGLWTANYLVEKGKKVLLLEQFPWPHTRGSSHGDSRITRHSYATSQHANMMPEAFRKWEKLEQKSDTKLFVNCGLLSMSSEAEMHDTLDNLQSRNVPHKCLTPSQIDAKFPGLASNGLNGLVESTAGVLKAKHCLFALKKVFVEKEGTFKDCEKVISINPVNEGLVKVLTNKDTYSAKSLVLTCGSWANNLLRSLQIILPIRSERVDVSYWKAKSPDIYKALNGFPCIIIHQEMEGYSTPILEYPGLMKVCCHSGVEINAERRDALNGEMLNEKEKIQKELEKFVAKYFPGLNPKPAIVESCIYSMTPDRDFILDRHPVYKNIIIGAGFSGHGFKLSPVVGEILGNLALNEHPSFPIHHFSISRFIKKSVL